MSSLRQLGSGLLYALVSVVLVVGGLSLALAEGNVNSPASATQPGVTTSLPVSTNTVATGSPEVVTATVGASATPGFLVQTATPQALVVTATPVRPTSTSYIYPSPRPTSTRSIVYHTPFACGPYAGWVLSYTVQPGDTLFHIATLFRTTVDALQIANCKPTTVIFPGERLWVPNVPTVTPGVTVIPTFPTSTAVPTEPLTETPLPYYTETAAPTDTSVPNP